MNALSYEQAVEKYFEFQHATVPEGQPQQPGQYASELSGTTWHLKNVNGLLAKVTWNGRVFIDN